MADTKISALTAATLPLPSTAVFPVVDVPGTSQKKLTLAVMQNVASVPFNVKAYGALGDGSTNDTAAIHAARDAAGANGTVFFPAGTYMVTTLLANVAGQMWIVSRGATIKQIAATNTDTITCSVADWTLTGGGVIDGNSPNQTAGVRTIYITADRSKVIGMEVQGFQGYGVQISGNHCEVRDCYFHGNEGTGIFFQVGATDLIGGVADRNRVDISPFWTTTLAAIANSGATNVKVTSVTGMIAGQQLWVGPLLSGEFRTILTVGTAGSGGTGVTLTSALGNTHASGSVISEANQNDAIAAFGDNTHRIVGLQITGNRCTLPTNAGGVNIEVKGGTTLNQRITVSGNYALQGIIGLSIADTDYAVVSGNTVIDQPTCVEVGGSAGVYSGNYLDGTTLDGLDTSGFSQTKSTVSGNTITGNTVRGFRSGVSITASDTTISGNTFYFCGDLTNGIGNDIGLNGSCHGTVITGNTFRGNRGLACINCETSPVDIAIIGNYFHATNIGIRSNGTGTWGNPFVVRSNTFDGVSAVISHASAAPTLPKLSGNYPDTSDNLWFPYTFALAADHAISTIAGTEVTGLGPITLQPGTYYYRFSLLCQSATSGVGISLGINFTGTAAVRSILLSYPSTGTTANTGVMTNVGAATGQLVEHNVQTAFSTTAPNMTNTAGFQAINTSVPVTIEGVLVVTAAGDLELWHGSETATSTTVKAGSTATVQRAA